MTEIEIVPIHETMKGVAEIVATCLIERGLDCSVDQLDCQSVRHRKPTISRTASVHLADRASGHLNVAIDRTIKILIDNPTDKRLTSRVSVSAHETALSFRQHSDVLVVRWGCSETSKIQLHEITSQGYAVLLLRGGLLGLPTHLEEIQSVVRLIQKNRYRAAPSLNGLRVLVSAGGTVEQIDPVRQLTNRSSGKQGVEIARAAAFAGADVSLISSVTSVSTTNAMIETTIISSARELAERMYCDAPKFDIIIMAAAVADFRVANKSSVKIKKDTTSRGVLSLSLEQTEDILSGLVARRERGQIRSSSVIVGFAAETGDESKSPLAYGKAKLTRKQCDYIFVNPVDDNTGFESSINSGWLLSAQQGLVCELRNASKTDVAMAILCGISEHVAKA